MILISGRQVYAYDYRFGPDVDLTEYATTMFGNNQDRIDAIVVPLAKYVQELELTGGGVGLVMFSSGHERVRFKKYASRAGKNH